MSLVFWMTDIDALSSSRMKLRAFGMLGVLYSKYCRAEASPGGPG